MRILFSADWQLGAGADLGTAEHGSGSRFQDQTDVLNRIADLAITEKVGLVGILGDVFERSRPSPREILVVQDFVRRMVGAGIRCLFVLGNHDSAGNALPSALEIFAGNGCVVSLAPSIHVVDDVAVATLPWTPPGAIVAAMPEVGRDDVNDAAARALAAGIAQLRMRCEMEFPEQTPILVGHWAISGAALPSGLDVGMLREPVIPLEAITGSGFSLAGFGHIHNGQVVSKEGTPTFYCGSPYPNSWGETEGEHGVWLYESEGAGDLRFVPVADNKRFVTYDIMASVDLAPMAWDVEGAVVRVKCSGTESEMRQFDVSTLRKTLLGLGALKVIFRPTILREERARSAEMTRDVAETDALDLWIASQQVEAPLATAMRDLHIEYLGRLR